MKPEDKIKPVNPTCPHLGDINIDRGFYSYKNPLKSPGLRLCVKIETCPAEIKGFCDARR